ncbi:MAG: hypothetical protein ACYC9M_16275 [Desulfobulbaceae bacterium]
MKLGDFPLHDSRIKSIIENPYTDEFTFNIDWAKDWDNNIFVDADLIFENVLNYEVHEGPFAGRPTILDAYEDGMRIDHEVERMKIKIETNAGYRVLFCTNVRLVENNIISNG